MLNALHSSAIGGHSGNAATYQRVKRLFYCPRLNAFVVFITQSCGTCQRAKHDNVPYPGLLEPLEVPQGNWFHIYKFE